MMWTTARLKDIAPSQPSSRRFKSSEDVWHLTLDQIESNTGEIVNKQIKPAEDAGNSTYVFDEQNVLYSKLRPYLNKVLCPMEAGIATTELVPLRPKPELIERQYLTYYLRSPDFVRFASSAVAGVKMPRIIMTKFWEHELPLPPLKEQHRIVEILDQADALRKQRTKADAKAARILPALFYQMFGDPLRNTKGLEMVTLSDPGIAEINPRMPSRELTDDLDVSFIPMADIDEKWGQITGTQTKRLAEVKKGFTSFRNDDVLFAKITPCMENGKSAIARDLCNGIGYGSTEFHVLRAGDRVTPEWIYGLIRLNVFRKVAKGSFTGSVGQQRVPPVFLRNFKVPLPKKEALEKYTFVTREMICSVHQRRALEQKIERLFQATIHRAFSGELTAKWREAHMQELLQEMEYQARALR